MRSIFLSLFFLTVTSGSFVGLLIAGMPGAVIATAALAIICMGVLQYAE